MTYSVKDVQERYDVSQATVLYWRSSGQLTGINVGRDAGKKRARYRFREADLEAFEAARASSPRPQPARRRRKRQADDVIEFIK